jgi:hypothetical protein
MNYSFSIDSIGIDLNKKLQNLRLLCQRMTAHDRNQRPNCDQILETIKEWGLNPSDLSIDSIVELLSQKSLCTKLLKNSFIKSFIKLKFNILRYLLSLLFNCVRYTETLSSDRLLCSESIVY